MQKTVTTSNHSSSGVSETKFLYSQAERLLAFSMEVWFQDNDVPGRHIMETALEQVRTATGTTPTSRHAPEPDSARSKPYPSVELIDSIVTWRAQNTGSKYIADLQSVISLPTLEAQWLALRNGQAKEPLRNHYIVSVNYAAWCFIGIKMAETTSGDIHKHLKSSKRFYEQNIIYGLQHMSVADLPTTALFQALLSGAMFAFNVGCFERAWTLNAAACRVYESLPRRDSSVRVSEAIPHAVELCYILDKTLSQIMDRAPSLGPGRIPKTIIPQDSISPVHGLYNLFSDMAEVQDAVVRALRHPTNSNGYSEQVESMELTFRCICENDPFWSGEVAATSYAASAIMASTLQIDLSASRNSLRQNELLAHARESLRYLLSALSYLSTGPDGYTIKLSVSWLIMARKLLFYPMNPYFTLYAFMLAHNDVEIYLLLSEITQGL
ncbi:C6 transcription factor [Colletotrichum asianum]